MMMSHGNECYSMHMMSFLEMILTTGITAEENSRHNRSRKYADFSGKDGEAEMNVSIGGLQERSVDLHLMQLLGFCMWRRF